MCCIIARCPPFLFFFLMIRPPPCSTLFPYTTLFRSVLLVELLAAHHHARPRLRVVRLVAHHQLYRRAGLAVVDVGGEGRCRRTEERCDGRCCKVPSVHDSLLWVMVLFRQL